MIGFQELLYAEIHWHLCYIVQMVFIYETKMENYRFASFKWKSKSLNTAVAERVQTRHVLPSSRRAIVSRTLVVFVA